MAIDYIDLTHEIVFLAKREGYIEFAIELSDAIDSASTSTELLMAVRFNLLKIPASISDATKNKAATLVGEIDKILK